MDLFEVQVQNRQKYFFDRVKEEKCLPSKVLIVSSLVEIAEDILALRKCDSRIDVLSKPFGKDDFEKKLGKQRTSQVESKTIL